MASERPVILPQARGRILYLNKKLDECVETTFVVIKVNIRGTRQLRGVGVAGRYIACLRPRGSVPGFDSSIIALAAAPKADLQSSGIDPLIWNINKKLMLQDVTEVLLETNERVRIRLRCDHDYVFCTLACPQLARLLQRRLAHVFEVQQLQLAVSAAFETRPIIVPSGGHLARAHSERGPLLLSHTIPALKVPFVAAGVGAGCSLVLPFVGTEKHGQSSSAAAIAAATQAAASSLPRGLAPSAFALDPDSDTLRIAALAQRLLYDAAMPEGRTRARFIASDLPGTLKETHASLRLCFPEAFPTQERSKSVQKFVSTSLVPELVGIAMQTPLNAASDALSTPFLAPLFVPMSSTSAAEFATHENDAPLATSKPFSGDSESSDDDAGRNALLQSSRPNEAPPVSYECIDPDESVKTFCMAVDPLSVPDGTNALPTTAVDDLARSETLLPAPSQVAAMVAATGRLARSWRFFDSDFGHSESESCDSTLQQHGLLRVWSRHNRESSAQTVLGLYNASASAARQVEPFPPSACSHHILLRDMSLFSRLREVQVLLVHFILHRRREMFVAAMGQLPWEEACLQSSEVAIAVASVCRSTGGETSHSFDENGRGHLLISKDTKTADDLQIVPRDASSSHSLLAGISLCADGVAEIVSGVAEIASVTPMMIAESTAMLLPPNQQQQPPRTHAPAAAIGAAQPPSPCIDAPAAADKSVTAAAAATGGAPAAALDEARLVRDVAAELVAELCEPATVARAVQREVEASLWNALPVRRAAAAAAACAVHPRAAARLAAQVARLRSLGASQSYFGIARELQQEDGWAAAVAALRGADAAHSPGDKMAAVIACVRAIYAAHAATHAVAVLAAAGGAEAYAWQVEVAEASSAEAAAKMAVASAVAVPDATAAAAPEVATDTDGSGRDENSTGVASSGSVGRTTPRQARSRTRGPRATSALPLPSSTRDGLLGDAGAVAASLALPSLCLLPAEASSAAVAVASPRRESGGAETADSHEAASAAAAATRADDGGAAAAVGAGAAASSSELAKSAAPPPPPAAAATAGPGARHAKVVAALASALPNLGGDEFLPILIFVLVRARLASPLLLNELLWAALDQAELRGHCGYYLTALEGACEYLIELQ